MYRGTSNKISYLLKLFRDNPRLIPTKEQITKATDYLEILQNEGYINISFRDTGKIGRAFKMHLEKLSFTTTLRLLGYAYKTAEHGRDNPMMSVIIDKNGSCEVSKSLTPSI